MSKTGVPLKLVGEDGNAFSILGRAQGALRRAGKSDLIDQYHTEATAGDYNHLLMVTMQWFDVDVDDEDDDFLNETDEECVCCGDITDDVYCESCYQGDCDSCN